MAILEVKNVHTYYGHIHALKDLSLTVEKGEIVTLIGAQRGRQEHDPQHHERAAANRGTAPFV